MKKAAIYPRKSLFEKAFSCACRLALQKKILLTVILLTNVSIASFSQKASVFLSSYDSCQVQPPQQAPFATKAVDAQTPFAIEAVGAGPVLRVAYVIPSNRVPQPNGMANLQYAIKAGQQFLSSRWSRMALGPRHSFLKRKPTE